MKRKILILFYLLALSMCPLSCYHEQEIPVHVHFDHAITANRFTVPVEVTVTNTTSGADFYHWTFEGASPATSNQKQPGTITYRQAGTHTIRLEAWNDTQRSTKEIALQLDSAVHLNFSTMVLVNDFVPAIVQVTNHTRGASAYEWTFEGGSPAASTSADPAPVVYTQPGTYPIHLKVTNGRETFSMTRTVTLQPALATDFAIVPAFEDEDYEAPLTARLQNLTRSGLRYAWSSTGGNITDPAAQQASIYFEAPGAYDVTLKAENDKETQSVTRRISVKPNRNLYVLENVKLGISTAHATMGCFLAPALRKVLTRSEVTTDNGGLVDLVFFGINAGFSYCRFLSPDSASRYGFSAIPSATRTTIINTLEKSPLAFTATDFDAMLDDGPLRGLAIKANDSGTAFFDNRQAPRVVLFETADGRKGAIKIKAFVADGAQSYILTDIKVQKAR